MNFVCAVCEQEINCRWNSRGQDRQVPPVCRNCEVVSGYGWNGATRFRGKPKGGSFMDRRNALRILALAEALESTARQIDWRACNAYT